MPCLGGFVVRQRFNCLAYDLGLSHTSDPGEPLQLLVLSFFQI